MTSVNSLFTPIRLGDLDLANRIIMAPLTRCRAPGHMPNELMQEYYRQRAGAGLIITECTMVMEDTSAFAYEPGIYNQEQIAAWKKITDAVHEAGGKIFMQIWHAGRAAHPKLNGGKKSVSAAAIAIEGGATTPLGHLDYTTPEALSEQGIAEVVAGFRQGAENAKEAGFDGVEIHAANGYLIDQFLRDGSNPRDDLYGGSWHNRVRFLSEIIDAVAEVWTHHRVGVRLSPLNSYNGMQDSNPEALVRYLCAHLNPMDLAYLHIMRSDFLGRQGGDVITIASELYKGNLMVNMGYSPEEAAETIAANRADMVAFGVPFIANPDYPERIRTGAGFNNPDPDTFYTPGAKGYTDYPAMKK